ncbi:BEN domain-containing protein 2 [Hyaena hyaena]|uniref:BEN domain-containing protein 2 n=1 Tax=Hyaena hyaena TaxID=95912 RepID=UPI0019226A68|nr:BEN domain-containing protein 2 [Hyaena hyaena]
MQQNPLEGLWKQTTAPTLSSPSGVGDGAFPTRQQAASLLLVRDHTLRTTARGCPGATGPSVPEDQQETQLPANPVGASLPAAASPEPQQPDPTQRLSPTPKIVSTFSLQSDHILGDPALALAALSYIVSQRMESASSENPSAPCPIIVHPNQLSQGKPSLAQFPEEAHCSTLPGNGSLGPHAASLAVGIPPNSEMPAEAEASLGNSAKSVYYPASLGHENGQDTASSSVFILPNFALEKVLLVEMPEKAKTSLENSSETAYYPTSLGNESGPDPASLSQSIPPDFGVADQELQFPGELLLLLRVRPNNSQVSNSSSFCIPYNFGYLGDPKREVKVLDAHLLVAQKKASPRYAVRYLIHILFSKEILMNSWVGVNSQGLPPLDPNKMAALREYLASVFPNYDLREYGKDWQACIADINSLIYSLRSEANTTPQKTGANSKGPTNPYMPVAADLSGRRYGKGKKSSSRLSQQTAASETRGNGNSQQKRSAYTRRIKECPTDNSTAFYETLEYIGNPDRNVLLPQSVLNIAKSKSRPELSSRYLIRNLFTEDVLLRSNVYGNLERGMYALNPNRINALREFLRDTYPTCDLSENGYDWKLCVAAINGCIRSLRYDSKKSASKA